MQVFKRQVAQPLPPAEYSIVLSEKEAALLKEISGWNFTIAQVLKDRTEADFFEIQDFLGDLFHKLEVN